MLFRSVCVCVWRSPAAGQGFGWRGGVGVLQQEALAVAEVQEAACQQGVCVLLQGGVHHAARQGGQLGLAAVALVVPRLEGWDGVWGRGGGDTQVRGLGRGDRKR